MKTLQHSWSNPDNWIHYRYKRACDRIGAVYAFVMYICVSLEMSSNANELLNWLLFWPAGVLGALGIATFVYLTVPDVYKWLKGY